MSADQSLYLDQESGDRTGLETGVWYFNVFQVGVVDNFVSFVPVDVSWWTRTVNNFTLKRHRAALVNIEVFWSNDNCARLWKQNICVFKIEFLLSLFHFISQNRKVSIQTETFIIYCFISFISKIFSPINWLFQQKLK